MKQEPISNERIDQLQAMIPKDTPFFVGLVMFVRLIEAEHGIGLADDACPPCNQNCNQGRSCPNRVKQ